MRNSRNQTVAVSALSLLFFGVVSSSCTTAFSKAQIADNSVILAQAFVDCVWEIDPEIYFDDARLAGHAFRQAPRAMKLAEYHGKPNVSTSGSFTGQKRFEESRLFSLDLPMIRANAIDERRDSSDLPAQFCLQVSVRYEADAAVYHFEFFSPRIAIDDGQRLVRDGQYVADLKSRSGYAIPATADTLIEELRKRRVPLDFAAQVFGISDDHEARRTGVEFLVGSGRVLVTEHIDRGVPRLSQLQAIVRLRDGVTARELYDGVLEVDSVRETLADNARRLTAARKNSVERIASAKAAEKAHWDRIKRRELAARRARDTDMFLDSLAQGANELESWQRQQSSRSYGGASTGQRHAAANQQAIEDSLEKGRVNGAIAAAERKIAADKRRGNQQRQRKAQKQQARIQHKIEDDARDFQKQWHDFGVELVIISRDLKRKDFAAAQSKYESLQAERKHLDQRLQKAGLKPTRLTSQDIWFQVTKKQLRQRSQGVRSRLTRLQATSGEAWSEHFVAKIAGVEFYQRVRARKWPDKAVDLTWRVVNTNNYPVWHSLDESAPAAGMKSYLWGGSDLKPGGSLLHEWVSYEPGRTDWRFEGFVRREN